MNRDDLDWLLNRPVFLTGHNSSGTSLLLALLDNHPQLVVLPEEPYFFSRVMFARDRAWVIRHNTFFGEWLDQAAKPSAAGENGPAEFDTAAFDRRLAQIGQAGLDEKAFMLAVVEAFIQADGQPIAGRKWWVSKQPREEAYFPLIQQMFGCDCVMVCIVRDPRDVYASLIRRQIKLGRATRTGWWRAITVAGFAVRWQIRVAAALRYSERHEKFLLLRFEDLVTDPDATLGRLCRLLEIDDLPGLRVPTRHGRPWGGNSAFVAGFNSISPDSIGRYRMALDGEIQAALERLLRPQMLALGYLSADVAPSARLSWIYAATLLIIYWLRFTRFAVEYQWTQWYAQARYQRQARRPQ
jgi:Sulfotransferase family